MATGTQSERWSPADCAESAGRGAMPGRPEVRGKFLFVRGQKLHVKGVTYGPFKPEDDGCEYHTPAVVERDFSAMAQHGINAVRIYTVPPRWLLDIAHRHGLYVMIGLPWEQHVTFLDGRDRQRAIIDRLRESVRGCARHPALLCWMIGNEIPTHIVRWYGHRPVERFLNQLCQAVKAEDPGCLVSYANYPSTEYLDLPFLDFVCFNVYLETQQKLTDYLARLHNIAGDRPLLVSEVGLDALHHGDEKQAAVLDWQITSIFASGCAGLFVFAWTDEWFRGGMEIEGWRFGLTLRDRAPRDSLEAVRRTFAHVPFAKRNWPRISVVVCTYNGSRTIQRCLDGLAGLDYPDYEVIVVDDGSTDHSAELVKPYDVRVIRTRNQGLSSARNTGMLAATGEIVAYIDDDAWPDPHWLTYLANSFMASDHAAVGGPNVHPNGDGMVADCVARAPGGPVHVLLTDHEAEHIPGCNMAFRRSRLIEIGGFDARFRIAGDDVDVCWRIQERGWTIGFSPAALVWHLRRNSIKAYWKQQFNYGRAEAMLEQKWPQKYNALGHASWAGRVYARGMLKALSWRTMRIYHGTWGSALFQSVYHAAPSTLAYLPATPEWYLLVALLLVLGVVGLFWTGLLAAFPVAALAAAVPVLQAGFSARSALCADQHFPKKQWWRRHALVAWMHLIQPAARLLGRFRSGLTPWRRRGETTLALPVPRSTGIWSETWIEHEQRLRQLEGLLRWQHHHVARGGDFDSWDLEIRGGLAGKARLRMTIEEHGQGCQMVRFAVWPRPARWAVWTICSLLVLSTLAVTSPVLSAFGLLALAAVAVGAFMLFDQARAMGAVAQSLRLLDSRKSDPGPIDPARMKPRPAAGSWRLVLKYAREARGSIAIVALLSLATPFATALTPWPIKLLVDHAIGGKGLPSWLPATSPATLIVIAAVSSLALAVLGTGLESLANLVWARAGQRMVRRLACDLMARMQRLSLRFHHRHEIGDLLSRLGGDTWSIYTAAEGLLLSPVQQVLTLVIVGALAWQLDPTLSLISLATAPLLALTAVLFGPPLRRRSQRQRTGEAKLHSFVHQTLGAISLVQTFGSGQRSRAQFDELADQAVTLTQRGVVLRGAFTLFTGVTTVVGMAAVIYFGANRVLSGALSTGGLLVFVAYYRTLQASSQSLMQTYGTYKVVQAHLDRVQEILESDDELPQRPGARTLESLPHRQALGIRFENVGFAYRPSQPVLENLDLSIAPGETVAIVGPTGAGKSTLVSLLPRLFDVRAGSVRIGGIDVRDLDLASLRRHIAVVPQEPMLIHGTIADNIGFGDPHATREQIVAAAIAAQADRFIRRLPDGYDTVLADQGAGLSGGQRQLLSIARALLKTAPILILDEPSSALDAVTEQALHEMLSSLGGRCTVVMIAHRLSTIRRADRIVVLERGRIAQVGGHEQLLSDDGPYRRLYETPVAAEVPA